MINEPTKRSTKTSIKSLKEEEEEEEEDYYGSREDWKSLKDVMISSLDQSIEILSRFIKDDDSITKSSGLIPGSTIGKHFRHIHDHFRILLESVERDDKVLNYDTGKRNLPMETSHSVLLGEFIELKKKFLKILEDYRLIDRYRSKDLRLNLIALTPHQLRFETTFKRELWFAALHATHHFALIRAIGTGELGLKLPEKFGVAPSTIVKSEEKLICKL